MRALDIVVRSDGERTSRSRVASQLLAARVRLGDPVGGGRVLSKKMQHSDPPAKVQAPPQPAGGQRLCVETNPLRVVPRSECIDGIGGQREWWGHVGQEAAVRPLELESAVGPARDLVALLVHRTVVAATEQRQVREGRGAALRPVTQGMPLDEGAAPTRETA